MSENSNDDQPESGSLIYRLVKGFSALIFTLFFRVRVYGKENLPSNGGFLICANDAGKLDALLLTKVIGKRGKIFFMAKEELFKIPFLSFIVRKLGSIPVKRKKVDRKAVDKAVNLLRNGNIVGIFPEAGRNSKSPGLQKPFDNQSVIALKSDLPVVPVAIKGRYKIFKTVAVKIGCPLLFNYDCGEKNYKREKIRRTNTAIMDAISEMLNSGHK